MVDVDRLRELTLDPAQAFGPEVEPGDGDVSPNGDLGILRPPPGWPEVDAEAFYGLAGDVIETVSPESEADPVALLVDFLTMFGCAVNRSPHAWADGSRHTAQLFAVIVGETSRSRKGTAYAQNRRVFERADVTWISDRVLGGFGSGEALVEAIRDPQGEDDPGVTDKRLLVREGEFARILRVANRENSTLSPIIREAWDGVRVAARIRKISMQATDPHVSVLADITAEELRRELSETDTANGFANRFLFACARRSKLLPAGGRLSIEVLESLGRRVRARLDEARRIGEMTRTPEAEELWSALYRRIAAQSPVGLVGAITSRAEAQLLRLSIVYALTDGSRQIDVPHLKAAWALWTFCEQSVEFLFGDRFGNAVADKLLAKLRAIHPKGLTGTDQHALFDNHMGADDLEEARTLLINAGHAHMRKEKTRGRRVQILRSVCSDPECDHCSTLTNSRGES